MSVWHEQYGPKGHIFRSLGMKNGMCVKAMSMETHATHSNYLRLNVMMLFRLDQHIKLQILPNHIPHYLHFVLPLRYRISTVLIVLSVGFHSVPTLILKKSTLQEKTNAELTFWKVMSPPSHSGSLSTSSESWSATERAHFTPIWMTGRTITEHNCHLYKLSCILCPWCCDNAHWKGVMSSPTPLDK